MNPAPVPHRGPPRDRSVLPEYPAHADLPRLLEVWRASAEAIGAAAHWPIDARVQQRQSLHCLRDDEGRICAFIGVVGARIDLLCVHPQQRGRGLGRALMQFAARVLRADHAEVEAGATQAMRFLQHLGFRIVERVPRDQAGNPAPLVRLSLDPFAPRHSQAAM